MKKLLVILFVGNVLGKQNVSDPGPAAQQILNFKAKYKNPIGVLTTDAGASVEYDDATNTLNRPLIFNEFFMDTMTHNIRERIPERVVHAKAAGAFGYFKVTHNITDICKAALFSTVGKKTPVAVRFSPAIVERGAIDTSREARGYAIKFYTEEGNFDIAGFNTPMYAFKDPVLFPSLVRSQKRNPVTNLRDANTIWDFLTLRPETLYQNLLIFGDHGIPDGYRHMPGFAIHTYQVVNERGESHFIRFHFLPDAGIKNLRSDQATKIASADPDYATRDLYNAIERGNFPSWTLYIQVLTLEQVKTAKFDVFDVTRILPVNKYPLRPVGRYVLNKNPKNYFADVEQIAFSPANLVNGILGAPDKLFEGRRFAYRNSQIYRLSVNANQIKVNCPLRVKKVLTYNRDGKPPVRDNERDLPNYYPNTYNGPAPYVDKNRVELIKIYEDETNNFDQARDLYVNEMTKDERSRLVENLVYSLRDASLELQERAVKLFIIIQADLGSRIQQGLRENITGYYY